MLSAGRQGEPPTRPGQYFLADAITAYAAFEGVLAALLHRERTGEGQLVQVNMLDALIALQMQELTVLTVGGSRSARGRDPRARLHPRARTASSPTADGYISLAFADLPTLGAAHRRAGVRADGAARSTAGRTATRSTRARPRAPADQDHGALARALRRAPVSGSGPVYGYARSARRPPGRAQRLVHRVRASDRGPRQDARLPVPFSRTPPQSIAARRLSASTRARCCAEAGYADRIEGLLASGAARRPAPSNPWRMTAASVD